MATSPARLLGAALEPVVGQVYFSPECHARYTELGFGTSPGSFGEGVAAPDGAAYFTSRGSVMGQVPGTLVAAAFGVFNPDVVVPAVAFGWTLTDAATICAERTAGAVEQLERVLGPSPSGLERASSSLERAVEPLRPEGRALYSGVLSLGVPDEPLAALWRRGDLLREFRGDSHIAAWISAGLDATEIGLLTELYWGLPMRTYIRTRAWTDDQLDAALARLEDRGLVASGGLTPEGAALREEVEVRTDEQMAPAIDALGDDLDELLGILAPWGAALRAACAYPASGPHDLAAATSSP